MTGIISNGMTALLAAQRALQTTSNNVANVNTEGYVRQRADFVALPGLPMGRFTIGAGVGITSITRLYDSFLTENFQAAGSQEQRASVFNDLAARVDAALGSPDSGINSAVQSFFNQLEALGRDPTSIAQRQQLILEAGALTSRFQQLDAQLASLEDEVDGRVSGAVTTVNALAREISTINDKLSAGGGGTQSSALLDQRDQALRKLAEQIDITSIPQSDGSVTVLVGSGQSLVLGNTVMPMQAIPDPLDPRRLQVGIGAGIPQNISAKISGGVLGGLLNFRSDVLDPTINQLGQFAVGLAGAFNSQHRAGVDYTGALGTDFFAVGSPYTSPASTNPGTSTATTVIADPTALRGRDYEARFDGTSWTVLDRFSGATIPATGAGTPADPLLFAGLSFSTTAGAADGDRFSIRPYASAASEFTVQVSDAVRVAAASPVSSTIGASNASQAKIGAPSVIDIADPKLLATATIVFDSPTSYNVFTGNGSDLVGPLPYTSGAAIEFGGWSVAVTGTPAVGDRFFVQATPPGSGDNGNVLALSSVAQRGYFNGGLQSLSTLGAELVSSVGATASRARTDLTVQQTLREQAQLDLEAVSGVNLDEEAADLMRFQEAFQAASKVIGIADNMFQTLLGMLR